MYSLRKFNFNKQIAAEGHTEAAANVMVKGTLSGRAWLDSHQRHDFVTLGQVTWPLSASASFTKNRYYSDIYFIVIFRIK